MQTTQGTLSWDQLDYKLSPWIREAIKSLGFTNMTPVQASTIPLFSGNKDVVVEAVTGSGKTLAFTIPVLERVTRAEDLKKGYVYSIILSPTRELANQINQVFKKVLEYYPEESEKKIRTQLLVGSLGTVQEDVQNFLRDRPQILIATPGRILEFLSSSYVRTSTLEMLVLDEADKLLDMSFEKDVGNIIRQLPKQRRTGLFSATISSAGKSIFQTGMTNPVKVTVRSKSEAIPTSLNISFLLTQPKDKLRTLLDILTKYHFKKTIVYFPTCQSVMHFYSMLQYLIKQGVIGSDLKFYSLHGKLPAKPRIKTLENFANSVGKSILMTTDVAARGIDIPDVDLVIQLDPPTDPDVFLHRSGRTGRANNVGRAIVMLNEGREEDYVDFMEVRKVQMDEMKHDLTFPDFDAIKRKWILEDRGRHELAVKAYVGFIRYYSRHAASSIFRLQTLDYLGIASMYGLLRLPKMPESKYISNDIMPEHGWLGDEIDMENYKYLDAQKETSRLEKGHEEAEARKKELERKKILKKTNAAWSEKVDKKEDKTEKREKNKKKRDEIEKRLLEESTDEETVEDWKDIVRSNKKRKTMEVEGTFDDL